jgi:hypothetical protein
MEAVLLKLIRYEKGEHCYLCGIIGKLRAGKYMVQYSDDLVTFVECPWVFSS